MVTTDKKELDSLLANLVRMWITHDLSNMRVINWWRKFYYAVNYALSDPPRSVCPQFITWGTAAVKLWQLRGVICQKLVILWLSCWRWSSCGCGSMSHCPKNSGAVTHSTSSEMSSALTAFYSFTKFTSYFLFLSLSLQRSHDVSQPVWQKAVIVCVSLHSGFCCRRWVRSVLCGVGKHSCPYRQRTRQTARDSVVWSKALEASDLDGSNLPNHSGISY